MRQRSSYLSSQIAQNFERRVKLLQPSLSPELVTQRLLDWTGGHPFLTYHLYESLIQGPLSSWALPDQPLPDASPVFDMEALWVDQYLKTRLAKNCRDPELVQHLRDICKCMIHDPRSVQMLKLYRRLLAGREPKVNLRNYVQLRLVQSGLAKVDGEYLVLSNRFYAEVFDRRWLVRAFRTVEARLRDEAVAAIERVFAEPRMRREEKPGMQALHPELQDRALLRANTQQATDCLLLNRPQQSFAPRPNPYRRHHRSSMYRMAMAMVTCTLGAVSILMLVNFSQESGEAVFKPPSMLEVREFLRNVSR